SPRCRVIFGGKSVVERCRSARGIAWVPVAARRGRGPVIPEHDPPRKVALAPTASPIRASLSLVARSSCPTAAAEGHTRPPRLRRRGVSGGTPIASSPGWRVDLPQGREQEGAGDGNPLEPRGGDFRG